MTPARLELHLPESQLQGFVINHAKLMGWMVHHSRPGIMRSGKWATPLQGHPGLPDIILVRDRVLWIELKSQHNRLKGVQKQWRDALLAAGQTWYCWRPIDWLNGTIIKVLA